MSTASPDLGALASSEPWTHFQLEDGDTEADALELLREAMGSEYSSLSDADATTALAEAVAYLEGATGRFFTARLGTLDLDGTGTHRLFCPYPLVSTNQDADNGGISEILIGDDTTALDSDTYEANDGIGLSGRDPRAHPFVDLVAPSSGGTFVSRPPGFGGWRVWPEGSRNVHVTALWGYVDADGRTPLLARKALALLAIRAMADNSDQADLDDLHLGAVQTETTRDRSVSYGERAGGGGITTNREIDLLIAKLKAPARVRVGRPPSRRVSRSRNALLRPVRGSY